MELYKKLNNIQKKLRAPKNNTNTFGGYNYRSCEDILESLKPVLDECVILLSDDMQVIGNFIYIKSTATLTDGSETISVSAFAKESTEKKGMSSEQITGTASSYARKYALNGLFAIDDAKDADTDEYVATTKPTASPNQSTANKYDGKVCPTHNAKLNRYGGHQMDDGRWCNEGQKV